MSKYLDWIQQHYPHQQAAYGQCAQATLDMQAEFPELIRVRGHYYCPTWGEREHWWLVDSDGVIIDPTALQFPSQGCGHYEPWDEDHPEPTGRCLNCGEYCYEGRDCCSDACHRSYVAFCTRGHY